jgi:hypothetical protein
MGITGGYLSINIVSVDNLKISLHNKTAVVKLGYECHNTKNGRGEICLGKNFRGSVR